MTGRSESPAVGTDEWFDCRERLWADKARRLVRALERYEDDHPKGAPCLMRAMDEARAAVEAYASGDSR